MMDNEYEGTGRPNSATGLLETWVPPVFVTAFALVSVGLLVTAGRGVDRFIDAMSYGGAVLFLTFGVAYLPPVRRRWRPDFQLGMVMAFFPLIAVTAAWALTRAALG